MAVTVRNHPELLANLDDYKGIAAFTDGRKSAVSSYLIPYIIELGDDPAAKSALANRLSRLYNVNECAPALAIHGGHLAQLTTINGLPDNDQFKKIREDVTGYGHTDIEFQREVLEKYMRDGRVGVLVDRPDAVAESAADARTANERAYLVMYEAREIRYWNHFTSGPRKGYLKDLVLNEPSHWVGTSEYAQLRRYTLEETGMFTYQLLRARDSKGLQYEAKAEATFDVVEEKPGALEYIPFFLWGCGPDESYLKEIWELNAARMNLSSIKSNINYNQAFQRNAAVGVDDGELEKAGESLVWRFKNENAKIFTIPAGDPVAIEKEEAKLANEINRRRKFEFNQLADDTRNVQSAESKAKDMVARVGIYNQTLDSLEELQKRIWSAVADYEGSEGVEIEVKIERDYGLDDEQATSLELHTAFTEAQSLGAKEVQKAILRTRLAKLRLVPKPDESVDEMRDRLNEDIEASGAEPEGTAAVRPGGLFGAFAQ